MGNSVRAVDAKNGVTRPTDFYDNLQTDEQAAVALNHPTDLKTLSESQFDNISRHGFELANSTLMTYVPDRFSRSFCWGVRP